MKTETAIEALFNTDWKTCTVQKVQKKTKRDENENKNEKGFLMSQVANTSSSLPLFLSLSVRVCVMTRIRFAFVPAYSHEINRLLLKFLSGAMPTLPVVSRQLPLPLPLPVASLHCFYNCIALLMSQAPCNLYNISHAHTHSDTHVHTPATRTECKSAF